MDDFLGFGLGLRVDHFDAVLQQRPAVDWFEVISENFLVAGGKPRHYLHAIREHYPMAMHGVSLSVGSTDPLDYDYLRALKTLANEVQPVWMSDHLCWTAVEQTNTHDLIPLPYTEEAVDHVAGRIGQVQEVLGRQMLIENVSSYVSYQASAMTEWEFLDEVARRADCLILFDVNNVYVSARNHGFDPQAYIDGIDPARVRQFHLAGGTDYGDLVIDTHDHPVPDPVWALYAAALRRFGPVASMIERDAEIPPLADLLAELDIARRIAAETLPALADPRTGVAA